MPNDGIDPGFPWPVAPAGQSAAAVAPADDGKPHVWAQKGFQFHDLLDIVNPLQHLPVVSSIYRWVTGDGIGNLPRVVGDTLYGGAVGFVSGLLGVLVKEESGKDIGEHMIATLTGDDGHSASATTQATQPADPYASETTAETQATPAAAAVPTAPAAATDASAAAQATTASSPATASPPPAPAVPDHPPIPLVRGIGNSVGATAASSNAPNDTASVFHSEVAQRLQPLQRTAENGRVLSSRPVPLEIPAGALNAAPPAPKVVKVMAPGTSAPAAATTATSAPAASPAPSDAAAPQSGQPIEISQKMLNALDKYMALQNARGGDAARGAQVDVSQ